jgi:predicted ATPase
MNQSLPEEIMITYFKAVNLSEFLSVELIFNEDLNIITGINGSGKTTIIKTIWLLYSGHINNIIENISFTYLELQSDRFNIVLERKDNELIIMENATRDELYSKTIPIDRASRIEYTAQLSKSIQKKTRASIFFPTFRRIEGGFITNISVEEVYLRNAERFLRRRTNENNELDEALNSYSSALSTLGHKFIASLSTNDIKSMLGEKFAEVNARINEMYRTFSAGILSKVSSIEDVPDPDGKNGLVVLEEIKSQATHINEERERLFSPFNVLSQLIDSIFNDKGIKISEYLSLGHQLERSIDSSLLSSGEKQMLSFLCYNIFVEDSPIFIDEPELSLHVDWQRSLFTILMNQKTNNQFFIATHSPFIYTKFADKELILNGNTDGKE